VDVHVPYMVESSIVFQECFVERLVQISMFLARVFVVKIVERVDV
jgi:hypothetical protein